MKKKSKKRPNDASAKLCVSHDEIERNERKVNKTHAASLKESEKNKKIVHIMERKRCLFVCRNVYIGFTLSASLSFHP